MQAPLWHTLVILVLLWLGTPPQARAEATTALPVTLADTGFFSADKQPYAPQYPLWSDGAAKSRWIALPAGGRINSADPDAWTFPPGTRLWKQIGFSRPVETRFIERTPAGQWRYATYVWNAAGTEATLAPAAGMARWPVAAAPDGNYAIPSREDCLACHEGGAVPVLGFSALQLSADRDPLAVHAAAAQDNTLDLPALMARGLLLDFPAHWQHSAPRIQADTAGGRAVLGYLHANCGHCHNDNGPLDSLELNLQQRIAPHSQSAARTLATTLDHASRFQPHAAPATAGRIVPGHADASLILLRMASHDPNIRMPPLGSQVTDAAAMEQIRRWINTDLLTTTPTTQEPHP